MLPFFRFQQSPCICRSININHVQTVFIETCLSASLSLPVFVLPIMSRCQLLRLSCSISTNLNSWTDMHATHTHTHTQTKSVLINIKTQKLYSDIRWKTHPSTHTRTQVQTKLPSFLLTHGFPTPDTLPLSSHLVRTINFISFFSSGGERNKLNLRASYKDGERRKRQEIKKREAEISWQSAFEGHRRVCGAETKKKKKNSLSQFHFTGGPINLCTPTHTYTHMHHSSDKQAHTHTHIHTGCLLWKHLPTYTQWKNKHSKESSNLPANKSLPSQKKKKPLHHFQPPGRPCSGCSTVIKR